MTTLTSIDYARLIQYAAQRLHRQMLNKTQVNKILFYVYGRYLALTGHLLFDDDSPKAWPYGPVFPKVNKKVKTSEAISFHKDEIESFKSDPDALLIVEAAVKQMHGMTASDLTRWSHQDGSPWYRTLFDGYPQGQQAPWNTEIKREYIEEYFSVNR